MEGACDLEWIDLPLVHKFSYRLLFDVVGDRSASKALPAAAIHHSDAGTMVLLPQAVGDKRFHFEHFWSQKFSGWFYLD